MIKKEKERTGKELYGYLGHSLHDLERTGAMHTAREISNQPQLWLDTWSYVAENQPFLEKFLSKAYAHADLDVILTGAGTSAYIGDILEGPFKKNSGKRTRAIATTDLVTHPDDYFNQDIPTLMISFARSGNSPESVAAVQLADQLCTTLYHLIITCNPLGELALNKSANQLAVFTLPPEANDQSLAMTGSFSSMLLAGLLISRLSTIEDLKAQVDLVAAYGQHILDKYVAQLKEVASHQFKRAIFLGSGPLYGAARESDLKLQELTGGNIICKNDSFLGFRHGPKVVIDPSTLIVYLFSNDSYVHQYEMDLVNTINDSDRGLYRIGIIESVKHSQPQVDLLINLSGGEETYRTVDEEFLPVCSVLPAQMLGFFKCLNLNLKPDSPSESNIITRVVEGVSVYPFDTQEAGALSLTAENNLV